MAELSGWVAAPCIFTSGLVYCYNIFLIAVYQQATVNSLDLGDKETFGMICRVSRDKGVVWWLFAVHIHASGFALLLWLAQIYRIHKGIYNHSSKPGHTRASPFISACNTHFGPFIATHLTCFDHCALTCRRLKTRSRQMAQVSTHWYLRFTMLYEVIQLLYT